MGILVLAGLLIQLALLWKSAETDGVQQARMGCILLSMVLAAALLLLSAIDAAMVSILMSVFVISQEVLGRWSFYRSRL